MDNENARTVKICPFLDSECIKKRCMMWQIDRRIIYARALREKISGEIVVSRSMIENSGYCGLVKE